MRKLRKYRDSGAIAFVAIGVWAVVGLAFWIGVIYIAFHFISKFW